MKKYPIFLLILVAGFSSYGQQPHISSSAHTMYSPAPTSDYFGFEIASGGDVNNDGFNDLVVYTEDISPPKLDLFFGNINGFEITSDWSVTVSGFPPVIDITGDYNNDGYDDILLGIYNSSVKIYYGGSGVPSVTPGWDRTSPFPSSNFGEAVCNAGDLNNDGYDDIVISAPLYTNGQENEGAILMYLGAASGPSLSYSWIKEYNISGLYLGSDVKGIGDINFDGYDDIAYSALLFNAPGPDFINGKIFVNLGNNAGLISSPAWVYIGEHEDETGEYLSSGDYNGDGFIDISFSTSRGTGFIYGNASLLGTTMDFLLEMESTRGRISSGDVNGDGFTDALINNYSTGWDGCHDTGIYGDKDICLVRGTSEGIYKIPVWTTSITTGDACPTYARGVFAGDLNGDGADDFYISDYEYNSSRGGVFFYYGSDFILPEIWDWNLVGTTTNDTKWGYAMDNRGDLNGDGYDDIVIPQKSSNTTMVFYGDPVGLNLTYDQLIPSLGASSTGAITDIDCDGDINGDGYDDCIIGTGSTSVTGINTNDGKIHLYYGTSTGISNSPSWSFGGNQAQAKFGTDVLIIGDINGDGYDDFAAGAPYRESPTLDEGIVLIFYGSPTGPALIPSLQLETDQDLAYFGLVLGQAGDVNADGFDDMLVGIPNYDVSCVDDGVAYLFFGSADGLTEYPNWVYYAGDCGGKTGFSVAGDVDINNDGYDDIIIGSPYYSYGGIYSGVADVFFGGPDGPSYDYDWRYQGDIDDQIGYSVSGIMDFNGDGFDDFMIGSPDYEYGSEPQGLALVFNGSEVIDSIAVERIYRATHNTNFAMKLYGGGDQNGDGLGDYYVAEPDFSNTDQITGSVYGFMGELAVCGSPSSTTVTSITENSSTVSWTSVDDALEYEIQWKLTASPTWSSTTTTALNYLISGLINCSNYEFKVRSICPSGTSAFTSSTNFTTLCPTPCATAPTGLFVNNITSTSAKFNWNSVFGAVKYKVYYKATTSPTWIALNATSNFKTISGLIPNTSYMFKVKAICDVTSTAFSSIVNFTTLLRFDDQNNENAIYVFPNPSSENINIKAESGLNSQVIVSNYLGEAIYISDFDQEININVSAFPKGYYLITIKSDMYIQSIPIIIN